MASVSSNIHIVLESEYANEPVEEGVPEPGWVAHVNYALYAQGSRPTLVMDERVVCKKPMGGLPPPPTDADLIFFECGEMEESDPAFLIEESGYCKLDPTKVLVQSHLCYWVRNPLVLSDYFCEHPGTLTETFTGYQRESGHTCYIFWPPIAKKKAHNIETPTTPLTLVE